MDFEQLKSQVSPELIAKAKACKTNEELTALLNAEKIELTPDQLEGISGGWSCHNRCPRFSVPDTSDW